MAKKGEKQSEYTKALISAKRKAQGNFRTGTKHSEETRQLMSLKALGNKNGVGASWEHSDESRNLMSEIAKLRLSVKENHPRWISDRSKVKLVHNKKVDSQYKQWSRDVKNRDKWKCRIANENCNGRLESHHILNWVDYPELRYELNNGITLCYAHHPRKRVEEKRLVPLFSELVKSIT